MSLLEMHRALLTGALDALATRAYWSPFPEMPSPKVYGETGQADGEAAINALRGKDFPLDQPGERGRVATEHSPYGVQLDIRYPDCDPAALLEAAKAATDGWFEQGIDGRIGILLEALTRIHRRSHEFAHAVMLTTGQGPLMAFQAGGPHAQDRALEALAYAWKAMKDVPSAARWEKPQGKNAPIVMTKHYDLVGRGVALVIGCATFPTWNTYPGLFAALATGNPVIVKPHPNAVLPAALTVGLLREVLAEHGLDPNLVTLLVGSDPKAVQSLACHRDVASIDFTGGNTFGRWLIDHARQARVYAEMAGVNTVIVESTADYNAMLRNLAFSIALYSGQMCTSPQNLFVPRDGIATDQGPKSARQFAQDLASAVDQLLADPKVATAVLGAIGSPDTLSRIDVASTRGNVVLASRKIEHPQYADAQVRTPVIAALDQADRAMFGQECFGPVSYVISTASAQAALDVASDVLSEHGALTLGVYSTDSAYIEKAVDLSRRTRVSLSINLTLGIYVNQSAAFSDYHASSGNGASTASYTNLSFVADRFVVVQRRQHS